MLKKLFSLLLFCSILYSQEDQESLTFYAGFSPDSNTFLGTGRTRDARFGYLGIQYSYRLLSGKKLNLHYVVDAIPYAFLEFPAGNRRKRAVSFLGIAPLGLRTEFPVKKAKGFVSVSGGSLYFNKRIPNSLGARFNFTANLSLGIEARISRSSSFVTGYKYYHISNAYRGKVNPGFDNNIFFFGYKTYTR